jgi:GMP synthase-like glutamine amidotransferase
MRIHYFQHVPFEDPAFILTWAKRKGYEVGRSLISHGEQPPDPSGYDLLVVMGGPMGVDDTDSCPWLTAEKEAIRAAIDGHKHVLGICLGGQLIADVLGARVKPNGHKEIGWFPVRLTEEAQVQRPFERFPRQFTAFHWHGDTFDLPEGAVLLGSSDGCHNQGFIYGRRVIGLQFHLEATLGSVNGLIEHCGQELTDATFVHTAERIRSDAARQQKNSNELLKLMLEAWLGV